MRKTIRAEEGSGNVFGDIGLPNAEERLAKAGLAIRISEVIRARRLTQIRAAHILKIDQPKISGLLRGQLSGFSAERLMHFFTLLGRDVEITIKPAPRSRREGRARRSDHVASFRRAARLIEPILLRINTRTSRNVGKRHAWSQKRVWKR
jgi:predicted XRE-type DNA-binding protein